MFFSKEWDYIIMDLMHDFMILLVICVFICLSILTISMVYFVIRCTYQGIRENLFATNEKDD